MSAFDRYIFRTTFGAFLLILISLTAVIWLTHALREIDLMTNQRQTILTFIGLTGLLIPMLVLVIAPLALVVAVGHSLNRLNTDSEIVVMNASGMSPWRIFRPFLMTTLVVSALVLWVSAYLAPASLRELRDWATKVKADFVVNIVQPCWKGTASWSRCWIPAGAPASPIAPAFSARCFPRRRRRIFPSAPTCRRSCKCWPARKTLTPFSSTANCRSRAIPNSAWS